MERSIVIKVKCGDALRRFNSRVEGNGLLVLDMETLRAKVLGLFNISLDADATLTYTDDDEDEVTLVDDDDLYHAVGQNLNPLRINVAINTEKVARSFGGSSGSSSPLRSPQVEPPLPRFNTGIAEVLKSVPGPLCEALLKLSLDMASNTAFPAPILSELVEFFKLSLEKASKVVHASSNPDSQVQFGADLSRHDKSGEKSTLPSSPRATKPEHSKNRSSLGAPPNAQRFEPASKDVQEGHIGAAARGAGMSVIKPSSFVDINPVPSDQAAANVIPIASSVLGVENKVIKNEHNCNSIAKPVIKPSSFVDINSVPFGQAAAEVTPIASRVLDVEDREMKNTQNCDSTAKPFNFGAGAGASSDGYLRSDGPDYLGKCPFSKIPLANNSNTPPILHPLHSFRTDHINNDNIPIFHTGVLCDGCGVHPIIGPRFKSKAKVNYDLCNVCFAKMGNPADYIRMCRPATSGHPQPVKDNKFSGINSSPLPHHSMGKMNPFQPKSFLPKLDSHFVIDVNVMDGTVMEPSTSFTKIWRMRNSGDIAWPHGVQLVWVGGDRLNDAAPVPIETFVNGVAVGSEVEIAVDMKAPELPRQYVSYWTMSLASGFKFGQLVWVLIQVEASSKPRNDFLFGLNLNLPPGCDGLKGAAAAQPDPVTQDSELPMISPEPGPVDTAASYEPALVKNALGMSEESGESSDDVEESMLKELAEMGFKQVDLNKEILRMNEFDLEQSVDDLCGVFEWDPILDELEEMGFCNKEVNTKLLKKNNGSLKRVVMDLIAGEKTNPKEKTL